MTTPRKPAAPKMTVTKTTVPAGAKLPTDHKPKGDGTTSVEWAGKAWKVNNEAFDDMDFLEAAELNQYVTCGNLMLGSKQYQEFKKHIADPTTGKSKASEFIRFIDYASDTYQAKNS